MEKIKQFFSAPVFADEALSLRAGLLSFFINLHLVVAGAIVIAYSSLFSEDLIFSLAALATCIPALGMRVLLHRGRVSLAATLFIGFIALTMPLVAVAGESSVATVPVTAFQFITLVMAGLLLGGRGAAGFLFFTCILNGGALYAEANGGYPVTATLSHFEAWITQVITYTAVAALLWLANHLIRDSFARARRENEERRAAEASLQLAVDAARLGTWTTDIATGKTEFSSRLTAIHGGQTPDPVFSLVHPQDRERVRQTIASIQSGQQERYVMTHRIVLSDGSERWLDDWGLLSRDRSGKPARLAGVVMDITDRKLAEQETQRRLNELATVNAISQVTASQIELDALIQLTGEKLRQVLNVHGVFIALYDPKSNIISFAYWRVRDKVIQVPAFPLGSGLISWVIRNRQPLVINKDYERRSAELGIVRPALSQEASKTPKAWLGVPMQVGDHVIGMISAQNYEQEDAFSENDIRLWMTIAANVGIAIQNAQLYAAAQKELAERKQAEQEREILQHLALELTAPLTLKELVKFLAMHCRQLFLYDSFRFDLYDEQEQLRTPVYAEDTPAGGQTPVDVETESDAQKPGVIRTVFDGKPVLVNRKPGMNTDGLTPWGFASRRSQSMMFIPVRWYGGCIGVVYVQSYTPERYNDRDLMLLQMVADQCGTALARVQADAELQKSASRLELLHNIDRALLSAQSPAEIAREALTRIRQLIPSQRTSITLFDFEKNEAIFLVASFDEDFNTAGQSVITLQEYGQYIIDELLQGKACRVDDVLTDPRCNELDKALAQDGFRSWLYLPLLSQEQLIGGLNFGRAAGNPFTAEEEAIAHEVANQLAIALKQNQLYEALQAELSERRRIQDILFEEKERAEVTLYSIGDAVITTDIHAQVDYLNPVAENLTGWKLKEAIGQPLEKVFQVVNEESRKNVIDPVARCLQEGRVVELANHSILIRRDGSEYSIDDSAAPIRNRKGEIIGAVLVFHDITEERRLSRQVTHDAMHDSLTGLVNRREFEKRLERALNSAKERNLSHVLCYLDLDQFKIVNDIAGHAAGDELLKQVGKLLSDLFRQRDTLARLGGDEFGLLLENCQLDQALVICNEVLAKTHDFSFICERKSFQVGVSIGVVPITAEKESVNQLLSQADIACYSAKDLGRNRVYVYQTEDSETVQRHSDIVQASRMKDAIVHNQFLLYCQPIVELAGDHLGFNHYEVLLRMVNDEKNLILPGTFIPSAERYGLMPAIDRWVIRQTFCAMSTHDIQGMQITINLSGNSLNDENLLDYVLEQLNEFSILPEQICFEITETAAIQHLSKAQKFIQAFRELGGKIALDDFGSGFSSFRYLKTLTVDYLKIDGAFVSDMLSNPSDLAMVEAITQMAHTLGIHVIAEHAIDLETINRLREMGVESAQGFGIGFPVPVEEAWKSKA